MLCSLMMMSPVVAHAVDEVVHAIDVAQERGLAAAGGADERGDLLLGNVHADAEQGLLRAVVKVEFVDLDEVRAWRWPSVSVAVAETPVRAVGHDIGAEGPLVMVELERTGGEFLAQALADENGREIEEDDEGDEKKGRGEHHRLSRFGIG